MENSKLFSFRIKQADGANCDSCDLVAPINDFFNGLWGNVELFMNNWLLSHSNNTHSYTSVISHLIHDSEESLHSDRELRLLYKDTAGQINYLDVTKANMLELIKGFHDHETRLVLVEQTVAPKVIEDPGNNGLHKRFLFSRLSKK